MFLADCQHILDNKFQAASGRFYNVFFFSNLSGTVMLVVQWKQLERKVFKLAKTSSCCESSLGSKCWTYHYVWSDLAVVLFTIWRGPASTTNSTEGGKCWAGCVAALVQILVLLSYNDHFLSLSYIKPNLNNIPWLWRQEVEILNLHSTSDRQNLHWRQQADGVDVNTYQGPLSIFHHIFFFLTVILKIIMQPVQSLLCATGGELAFTIIQFY